MPSVAIAVGLINTNAYRYKKDTVDSTIYSDDVPYNKDKSLVYNRVDDYNVTNKTMFESGQHSVSNFIIYNVPAIAALESELVKDIASLAEAKLSTDTLEVWVTIQIKKHITRKDNIFYIFMPPYRK